MAELLIAAGVSAGTATAIVSAASTAAAVAAPVAAAAGIGLSTYSAVRQQSQASDLAKSSAKAAEIQATAAEQQAAYSETQFRRRAAFVAGEQEAAYAASGVDVSSGSPMLQELDTMRQTELEAENIKRGGDVQAATARYEAGIRRFQGTNYQQAIPYTAAAGLTQGADSILGYWTQKPRGRGFTGGRGNDLQSS